MYPHMSSSSKTSLANIGSFCLVVSCGESILNIIFRPKIYVFQMESILRMLSAISSINQSEAIAAP